MTEDLTIPVVLVVEDEPLIRLIAVEVLTDAGYEVIEAADADEALLVIHSRTDIKVVFSDINMPGDLDGVELAQEVRRLRPHARVILTSGRPLAANDEELVGAFLPKPYSPEVVVKLVNGAAR